MSTRTTAAQLRTSLIEMTDRLAQVLRKVPVKYFDNRGGSVVFVTPDYYWGKPSAELSAALHAAKRDYGEWIEIVRSVFRAAPADVERGIDEADSRYRMWLELEQNWSLGPKAEENEAKFREDASAFDRLLDILDSATTSGVIVIPDTNSIIAHPDPSEYLAAAGTDRFTFLLLPTVLSELDELKNLHRNPDFRDKAKSVIMRVKGWRAQGSLSKGVKVNGTITVRAIAAEPNMRSALSWLDSNIKDDRIIASVLEVQAANPNDSVILVTGDINLMNKADAARIHSVDM